MKQKWVYYARRSGSLIALSFFFALQISVACFLSSRKQQTEDIRNCFLEECHLLNCFMCMTAVFVLCCLAIIVGYRIALFLSFTSNPLDAMFNSSLQLTSLFSFYPQDVLPGFVVCSADALCSTGRAFEAQVIWIIMFEIVYNIVSLFASSSGIVKTGTKVCSEK